MVLDVDDLHLVQVERHDQTLDGPRIAVLRWCRPHERQRTTDQRGVVVVILRTVIACGPWVDHGEAEVSDATLAHGLLPPRILPDLLLDSRHVLDEIGREPAGDRRPRVDDPAPSGRRRLVDQLRRGVVHRDECAPRHVRQTVEAERSVLVRLGELDHHELRCRRTVLGVGDDRGGGFDLRTGQRVERIWCRRRPSCPRAAQCFPSSFVLSFFRSRTPDGPVRRPAMTLCAERRPKK